jgi:hypothetical protein
MTSSCEHVQAPANVRPALSAQGAETRDAEPFHAFGTRAAA